MSEWCDSQKKPNSDFRKLLQERIYKANPRRDVLTKEEQKKIDKLINDDGYCIVACPNGSMTGLLANPNIWKYLWGEVHPNFISDEYLLNIFSDYEGAVFDAPSGLVKYDYLNHLDYPPVSFLPETAFLLGVFRRTMSK